MQFIFGFHIYTGLYREIFKTKSLGMNALVFVGTLIPFCYSLYLACLIWMHVPTNFTPFFYTCATIILIVTMGDNINFFFTKRLSNKVNELNDKKAEIAHLIDDHNQITDVKTKSLTTGQHVLVKQGEIVPTDGKLVSSSAMVDASMFNGEMVESNYHCGDEIYGGVINKSEPITLIVTHAYKDSMLNQLIKKVQRAQGASIHIRKTIDKVAAWFAPTIIVIAVMFFLIQFYCGYDLPNFVTHHMHLDWAENRTSISVYYAIGVLVSACPCVFGIAIPLVLVSASAKFLKHGILLNKSKTFETINDVKAIAFDKTGTLTTGQFAIKTKINEENLAIFYAISKLSDHVLSKAFSKDYEQHHQILPTLKVDDFHTLPGVGLQGTINGKTYKVVSKNYLDQQHIQLDNEAQLFCNLPLTIYSFLINNNEVIGIVGFSDEIKDNALAVISELKRMGYYTYLITGDHEKNAKYLQEKLGLDEVFANVLPTNKANNIEQIQQTRKVMFVGDGLNDVAALQQANVSFAMNSGSSISKSVSDFIIINNDLQSVVDAIKIINQAKKTIKANLIWAVCYNLAIAPISGLGIIFPIISAICMGISNLMLVNNAFIFKVIPLKTKK